MNPLSSTSRLGPASRVLVVGTLTAGLGCAAAADQAGGGWPAAAVLILLVATLLVWGTRVRTAVTDTGVRFCQFGKTIIVPYAQVHGCRAHPDHFGLGAGLRRYGPGRWGMLSGDGYLDISYGDGRALLVSHRDPEGVAAEIMRHLR